VSFPIRRHANEAKARELCYNIVQTVTENTYDADLELFHHVLFEVPCVQPAEWLCVQVVMLMSLCRKLVRRTITIRWRWWCT